MNLFLLNASSSGASSGAKTGGTLDMIVMLLPMVLIFGVMWFVMIRPQRKKQKEEEAMKNNTQVGDEILSIGGIYGKIIAVKEDSFIIETGPDRSKIRLAKWGIQQNFTVHENVTETVKADKKSANKAEKTEEKIK